MDCLSLDNKREKIIVLTKESKVQARKVILPLFDREQKAAEKISDKKSETTIDVQTAFALHRGWNNLRYKRICDRWHKNSGAMEQAYNLGKAIK